jgi:hypothetical protein
LEGLEKLTKIGAVFGVGLMQSKTAGGNALLFESEDEIERKLVAGMQELGFTASWFKFKQPMISKCVSRKVRVVELGIAETESSNSEFVVTVTDHASGSPFLDFDKNFRIGPVSPRTLSHDVLLENLMHVQILLWHDFKDSAHFAQNKSASDNLFRFFELQDKIRDLKDLPFEAKRVLDFTRLHGSKMPSLWRDDDDDNEGAAKKYWFSLIKSYFAMLDSHLLMRGLFGYELRDMERVYGGDLGAYGRWTSGAAPVPLQALVVRKTDGSYVGHMYVSKGYSSSQGAAVLQCAGIAGSRKSILEVFNKQTRDVTLKLLAGLKLWLQRPENNDVAAVVTMQEPSEALAGALEGVSAKTGDAKALADIFLRSAFRVEDLVQSVVKSNLFLVSSRQEIQRTRVANPEKICWKLEYCLRSNFTTEEHVYGQRFTGETALISSKE